MTKSKTETVITDGGIRIEQNHGGKDGIRPREEMRDDGLTVIVADIDGTIVANFYKFEGVFMSFGLYLTPAQTRAIGGMLKRMGAIAADNKGAK